MNITKHLCILYTQRWVNSCQLDKILTKTFNKIKSYLIDNIPNENIIFNLIKKGL